MDTAQLYELYRRHPLVSTDTRKIQPDSLFFALKGPSFDANQFANEALAKGAAYAVVDDPAQATTDRHLLVDNGLVALQQLARHHRRQLPIPVLAITGTNGKTTTKELVSAVLAKKINTLATVGNLNNHIGVPLTLLALTPAHEVAVIEMGANHVGDIQELCQIAEPNYGLITNIGQAHLEGFGSFEGVIRAKSELYDHLRQHGGVPIINARNEILTNLGRRLDRAHYYGLPGSTFTADLLAADPYISYRDEQGTDHQTQLLGAYNFDNILAALCVGRIFGVPDALAHEAVASYTPTNNRSQVMRGASNTIIADAYNANPSSMRAALESFARMPAPRKVVVLGDMFELGTYSQARHREVLDLAASLHLDQVLVCGQEFGQARRADDQARFFATKADLADWLAAHPLRECYLLLKGSRGMGLETLLPGLLAA
jgi:UDP-N-acetylmuramoyl-tripeptide--D-alanyl-D-alanine ligase